MNEVKDLLDELKKQIKDLRTPPSLPTLANTLERITNSLDSILCERESAKAVDEWVRRLSAPITPEELKRAWNMIGQAHPQKEWVERALIGFIELRLAAALKPEA